MSNDELSKTVNVNQNTMLQIKKIFLVLFLR